MSGLSKHLQKKKRKCLPTQLIQFAKNHEKESWARMYYAIITTITHMLVQMHADEMNDTSDCLSLALISMSSEYSKHD